MLRHLKSGFFSIAIIGLLSFSALGQNKPEPPKRASSIGTFSPGHLEAIWRYGGSGPTSKWVPERYGPSPASVPETEWQEKARLYKEQTGKNPNDSVAFYNLGVAHSALKQNEMAVEAFSRAIALREKWSAAQYNLANAYADSNQHQKAIAAYKETIKLNSSFAEAYYNLALTYLAAGDGDSAKEQHKLLKSFNAKDSPAAEQFAAQLDKVLSK